MSKSANPAAASARSISFRSWFFASVTLYVFILGPRHAGAYLARDAERSAEGRHGAGGANIHRHTGNMANNRNHNKDNHTRKGTRTDSHSRTEDSRIRNTERQRRQ